MTHIIPDLFSVAELLLERLKIPQSPQGSAATMIQT